MKKYVSILAVAGISMLLITQVSCKKDKELTLAREGYVNFLSGNVMLVQADGSKTEAGIGDAIKEDMKISTDGKDSMAEIYIGENVIKVLGNTIINIEKLNTNIETNGEESLFVVEKGRVFSRVKQKLSKKDNYTVKTPTAIAAVRGTDFLVSQEDEKSNVACVEGLVAVLNQSLGSGEPMVLEDKEEVDVVEGKDMVKQQISADKMRMLNIISEIKDMRMEIRRKYEEQREEILQHVKDQKEKNKTMLEEQREKDKALVEDQKARDRALIDEAKGTADESAKESLDKAKDEMESARAVDKDESTSAAKEQMESTKPKIEKPKIDMDQFKQ
ncbi:MAG: FecR domain-containing protein [Spirochaetota bacterium]